MLIERSSLSENMKSYCAATEIAFNSGRVRSEGRTSRPPVLQALKSNFFGKEAYQKPWNHPIPGLFLIIPFDSFLMVFDPSKWVTMGDLRLNLSKWVTEWVTGRVHLRKKKIRRKYRRIFQDEIPQGQLLHHQSSSARKNHLFRTLRRRT